MSLILDALKRAERERRSEHAPVLEAAPPPSPRRPRLRRPLRLVAVIGLIAVVLGAGWALVRDRDAPPADDDATDAAVAQTAPDPAPEAATVPPAPAAPTEPAPEVIPGTESVASLEELTEGVVDEAPAEPPPATESTPSTVQPAAPPPTAPSSAEPTVTPSAPAATATPPPAVPPALTQPAPLRKLREMPPDYRADFPALTVEVHVFERNAAERFVRINGRRYKQGDALAEGPRILEIVREGIVLEYRGQKVLYPLGR